jgi:hypothetical protein
MIGTEVVVSIGPHEEEVCLRELAGEELQEQQGRCVRGMEVVEHEDQRLALRRVLQEGADRVEQSEAAGLRIGEARRLRKIDHDLAELGEQGHKIGRPAAELAVEDLRVAVSKVRAQGLDPRPVRGCPARFPTPAPQHLRAAPNGLVAELVGQPALADPRLPPEEEQPPPTG